MPKASTGKRKGNTCETAPSAKRQRASNAPKTPKAKAVKVKRRSAATATQRLCKGDAKRVPALQDLPDNVLANVFCALGLDRLRAMQVCKQWMRVGQDPCFTKVVTGETINDTIASARPGDTIELKAGFYQEVVLVEKPLKFVGQWSINKRNQKYKDVVLQSNRSMAVMCNARACFERLVIRTILPGGDRSIVGFGPDCSYIALHDCNLDGISGLLVPRTRSKDTTLELQGCYIHGVAHMAAVTMEGGNLRMEECTLTNCQVGLNVHEGVCVILKNNDISFNEVGLIFDGYGIIQNNKMWGNLHRSTIDLGKEALARAKEKPPLGDFEQLLAKYHAEQAERSKHVDKAAPAGRGDSVGSTELGAPDQPGGSAPPAQQPEQAAAPAGQAQQHGGLPSQSPLHAATRRTACPAAPGPPLYISGNHIQRPQRLRKLSEDHQKIRRRVRKLAAEVYGAHEQNGEWNDEGEWHVVGDEDLESSDNDLLGSDVESTSDSDGLGIEDIEDDDNDFDSSGEDWDSEDWDEAGMPILHPGEDTEYSSSSDEEESDEGDNTERSDDSMHTSDFETSHDSQDGSSDGEAVQQL